VYSDHAADEYGKGSMASRLLNPSLAGGPLMDLGPYPMVWVSTFSYYERSAKGPRLRRAMS
jgi:hypothetical protein